MVSGTMNAIKYGKIIEARLVPFVWAFFPDEHRLQQDSDPKHSSKYISCLYKSHGIYWWKTSLESPDLNPIENYCGSLKQYLRSPQRPTNLEELMNGIEEFWQTLTPDVCKKYISHLQKVMPKIMEQPQWILTICDCLSKNPPSLHLLVFQEIPF